MLKREKSLYFDLLQPLCISAIVIWLWKIFSLFFWFARSVENNKKANVKSLNRFDNKGFYLFIFSLHSFVSYIVYTKALIVDFLFCIYISFSKPLKAPLAEMSVEFKLIINFKQGMKGTDTFSRFSWALTVLFACVLID